MLALLPGGTFYLLTSSFFSQDSEKIEAQRLTYSNLAYIRQALPTISTSPFQANSLYFIRGPMTFKYDQHMRVVPSRRRALQVTPAHSTSQLWTPFSPGPF